MPLPILPLAGLGALLFLAGAGKKSGTAAGESDVELDDAESVTRERPSAEGAPGEPMGPPKGKPMQGKPAHHNIKPPLEPVAEKPPLGPASVGPAVMPSAVSPEAVEKAEQAMQEAERRNWQEAAAAAAASGDAQTMELVAEEMVQDGAVEQGASLNQAAQVLREEAAQATTALRQELQASGELEPGVEVEVTAEDIRAAEPAPPAPVEDPTMQAARDLAAYLATTSRYNEDKTVVAAHQQVLAQTPDGLYGPATALALADRGIVPPNPFYWPRVDTVQVVSEYKAEMLDHAEADPGRASEWKKAAAQAGR